jgi:hypothetical protein
MRRSSEKITPVSEAQAPGRAAATSAPPPPNAAAVDAAAVAAAGNGNVEKCVNCQYYDRRNAKPTDGKAPLWGQCRKHAPRLNPVTAKAYVVEGVWPLVRDDDWCGEWKVLTRVVDDWIPEELPVPAQTAAETEEPARAQASALPPATPTRGRSPAPANAAATATVGDD